MPYKRKLHIHLHIDIKCIAPMWQCELNTLGYAKQFLMSQWFNARFVWESYPKYWRYSHIIKSAICKNSPLVEFILYIPNKLGEIYIQKVGASIPNLRKREVPPPSTSTFPFLPNRSPQHQNNSQKLFSHRLARECCTFFYLTLQCKKSESGLQGHIVPHLSQTDW